MLPRNGERDYVESDNKDFNNHSCLANFLFFLHLFKSSRFSSHSSIFSRVHVGSFPSVHSPSPINVRFAYVCHLFTISGRECNQSGWKQMQPIRYDGQIRTDWGGQISIRSANAFNTDVDNRSCNVVVFSKWCAIVCTIAVSNLATWILQFFIRIMNAKSFRKKRCNNFDWKNIVVYLRK